MRLPALGKLMKKALLLGSSKATLISTQVNAEIQRRPHSDVAETKPLSMRAELLVLMFQLNRRATDSIEAIDVVRGGIGKDVPT